jgi:flagellar basal-body rod protein FlgB
MTVQPFAQHVEALKLRELRNEILSSNIANADTPNYKARDFDFAAALAAARDGQIGGQLRLTKTNPQHSDAWGTHPLGADVKYRIPMQPTLDGNTVETDVEQAAFAENAVQYRASLEFLNTRIRWLQSAIRGDV